MALVEGGVVYYFLNSKVGAPQLVVDGNQQVVWEADYSPFGEVVLKNEKLTQNLRFPGQYYDAESGLHYNWHRYYDPALGRYLQPDPIGLAGGTNLYAYVGNNPMGFVDRLGLELVSVNLPGLGPTYLDDAFLPSVQGFIANAAANGVNLHFNSAYRTPQHQANLRNDLNAITPADRSLHSCGFAVDVNYSSLPRNQQRVVRDAASAAGLSWGGNFHVPDPPHFYSEPAGSRETAIQNATQDYLRLTQPNH